ncbi:hypothetical protein [Herbaspirillum sp. YR522]|uniref:hypothetical protein n=1 Tax=Herbaspirillum sp. YR522 TaxID=1144342 RepID=UPI00026FA29A|nr:hypothetical protein [Herbaspirillum sp. YR522]EJN06460.1 hypothetical protein PMI40_02246 [Herbaspirillum sp. YR522]
MYSLRTRQIIAGCTFVCVAAVLYAAANHSAPSSVKIAAPAEGTSQIPAAPMPPEPEEPPLTKAEAAEALSAYMHDVQGHLYAQSAVQQLIVARIKQDIEWGALDKFRADAGALKGSTMDARDKISALLYPENLSSEDQVIFEKVVDQVSEVTMQLVELGVDVSASANTGLDFSKEMSKDAALLKKATQSMKTITMAAYKQFGVPAAQIDKETLTLLKQ